MLHYYRRVVNDKYPMRLHEIEDSVGLGAQLRSMTPKQVLASRGWEILGSGYEGSVAQHPSKPYVLKLFESNSLYKEFIAFCRARPGNPHLPRFYTGTEAAKMTGAQTGIGEDDGARKDPRLAGMVLELPGKKSAVRMERLKPITEQLMLFKFRPELYVLYLEGINQGMTGLTYELRMMLRKRLLSMFSVKSDQTGWLEGFAENRGGWHELWNKLGRSPDESWIKTVMQLMDSAARLGTPGLDLHEDNLMRRGETLVITDPFV